MFPRFNLLFSCLILIKVAIAVAKGFYSAVLKVCNEIENKLTLKYDENSHFPQNARHSGMASFNNHHLSSTRSKTTDFDRNRDSTSVDFLIYNLPIGRKITVRHLKRYEVITDSSEITYDKPNFQQGMTVQGTSHSAWLEPLEAFDGEMPRTPSDCSTPLNHVYTTSQDRGNQNQAKGIESFPENLRSTKNAGQPSKTKVFAKASDGNSYLQMQIFDQNIKSHLNKSHHTKKEISEFDSLNAQAQFVERHELQSFPSEGSTLCTRMSVESSSGNKNDESICLEENKTIQSSGTQIFKNKEHNSDTYIVKSNVFHSNYTVTDHPLDKSKIDCQNDENNYNETEDCGDIVAETNKEKLYLRYPMDDGTFTSCSQINSDETKESSYSFWKDQRTFEFQGKFLLESSEATNIQRSEGNLNHSKAAYADKCNTKCSEGLIKDEMLNDEFWNVENVQGTEKAVGNIKHGGNLAAKALLSTSVDGRTENVQDTEKCLENMKHGENPSAKASLSTVTNINTSKSKLSSTPIPKASNNIEKYDKAAYLGDLVEMKPDICSLEDAMVSWCRQTIGICGSTTISKEYDIMSHSFTVLMEKLKLITNPCYYESVLTYVNEMGMVFPQIQMELVNPGNGNHHKGSSYVDDIRRKLVKMREILLPDSEELNTIFTEKRTPETRTSRKSKSKNKRRRK